MPRWLPSFLGHFSKDLEQSSAVISGPAKWAINGDSQQKTASLYGKTYGNDSEFAINQARKLARVWQIVWQSMPKEPFLRP
jgi:hypothetical protein